MDSFIVYRVGSLEKTRRYGERLALFEYVDERRPDGAVGRLEGLFCLPALAGVDRWVTLARRRAARQSLGPEATTVWQVVCVGVPGPVYSCVNWETVSRAWDALQRDELAGADSLSIRSRRRALEKTCEYLWTSTASWHEFQDGRSRGYPWNANDVEMLVPPALIVNAEPVELALGQAA